MYMKLKNLFFIIIVVTLFFLSGCSSITEKNENTDLNNQEEKTNNVNIGKDITQEKIQESEEKLNKYSISDEELLNILKTDKDGKDYLSKYPNTKVVGVEKILPKEFEVKKAKTQYKEIYMDLPNKELYYVEFNGGTSLSLITIIDLDEKKVVKIFGVMILGIGN